MSDGAILAVASPPPDPSPAGPGALPKVNRLLGLVRTLVAYGTNLMTTLQQRSSVSRCKQAIWTFGTKDLALIIARIKCGLLRAAVLEARLNDDYIARGKDLPEPAERLSAPRSPRAAALADVAPPAARATLLAALPTAEEIAEQVRTRSLGVVIGDICHDFGLVAGLTDRDLWDELFSAAIDCGIDLTRWMSVTAPVCEDDEEELEIALSHWPVVEAQGAVSGAARPP